MLSGLICTSPATNGREPVHTLAGHGAVDQSKMKQRTGACCTVFRLVRACSAASRCFFSRPRANLGVREWRREPQAMRYPIR